jgi:hypothetical protein
MAAEEVIHFPFRVQLSLRPHFSALSPPEPVANPPPYVKIAMFVIYRDL